MLKCPQLSRRCKWTLLTTWQPLLCYSSKTGRSLSDIVAKWIGYLLLRWSYICTHHSKHIFCLPIGAMFKIPLDQMFTEICTKMKRNVEIYVCVCITLPKKSFNGHGKSTSNDIHWIFHIGWMWSHPFDADTPYWLDVIKFIEYGVPFDVDFPYSLNVFSGRVIVYTTLLPELRTKRDITSSSKPPSLADLG